MMRQSLCVLFLLLPLSMAVLLRQWPMIISHDSATGEIDSTRDGVIKSIEDAYSITQSTGLVNQIQCGARSLDYRPYLLKDGSLIAHHGSTKVHKLMNESVAEITTYLLTLPASADALVILYLSHFEGETDGCQQASVALLKKMGIPVIQDCALLGSLTVDETLKMGRLVALVNCIDERYDPAITCYGVRYQCYDSTKADVAWDRFEAYALNSTSGKNPPSSSELFMTQLHWQSSTESVPLGLLHGSSVVEDESRSQMNTWVAQKVALGKSYFNSLNLIELDNVCDGGLEIYKALKAFH